MAKRFDGLLRAEIIAARRQLMEEVEKYYSEKWVTGKELTKLYPCFTKSWLSSNGCHLPRTRVTLYDDDGNEQNSQWGYSLNRIKKAIEKGYVQCRGKRFYFNKDNTGFSVQSWWGY